MTTTITKRLEFDYGHRVLGHDGKCRHLHGHRGRAEITVEAWKLNELDMVIDFGDVKTLVGGWIDKHWDHNLLLHEADPLMTVLTSLPTVSGLGMSPRAEAIFGGRNPFIMPNGNPTAENMAAVLFHEAVQLLKDNRLTVLRVRLYETPTCFADVVRTL